MNQAEQFRLKRRDEIRVLCACAMLALQEKTPDGHLIQLLDCDLTEDLIARHNTILLSQN